jgi:hypothetical protein
MSYFEVKSYFFPSFGKIFMYFFEAKSFQVTAPKEITFSLCMGHLTGLSHRRMSFQVNERAEPLVVRNSQPPQPLRLLAQSRVCHMTSPDRGVPPQREGFNGRFHYSTLPLSELRPITLREMLAPRQHSGHCLLCRVVKLISESNGLVIYIEDLNGDCFALGLCFTWGGYPCTASPKTTTLS